VVIKVQEAICIVAIICSVVLSLSYIIKEMFYRTHKHLVSFFEQLCQIAAIGFLASTSVFLLSWVIFFISFFLRYISQAGGVDYSKWV